MRAKLRYAVDKEDYAEFEEWAEVVEEDKSLDGTMWYALKFTQKPGESDFLSQSLAPQWFTSDEVILEGEED